MKLLIFLIGVCFSSAVSGQTPPHQINKIIPASPTSAALGKFGDIPVSLFNGTPSINIPLYEVRTPNHALDVQMVYDASGTKVNEDASWVGLHWSLSAGGVITRTIRQKDDLTASGYKSRYSPIPDEATPETRESFYDDVFINAVDAEPDIFSYNFCGLNGRFLIGRDIDGNPIYQDQKNNLQIKYISENWEITDAQGYKYYFNTGEYAQNFYYSGSSNPVNFVGLTYGTHMPLTKDGSLQKTAWYLDSIVAQTGEVLKFSYTSGVSYSLVGGAQNYYREFNFHTASCSNMSNAPMTLVNNMLFYYSRQEISNVYLKKIEFLNGSIDFKLSERADIEGAVGPSRLDSILIKTVGGELIKSFAFNYTYFNSANIHGRLKLDSIRELDRSGRSKQPYRFSYLNPNDLPEKNSNSIDHWGYWNGKNNLSFLDYSDAINPFGQIQAAVPYANRNADEDHIYPAYGVISKITYPTGGSSQFEFELNEFGNLTGDMAYNTINKNAAAFNISLSGTSGNSTVEFTIPPVTGLNQISLGIKFTYQNLYPNNGNLEDSSQEWITVAKLQSIDANGNATQTLYTYGTDRILNMSGTDFASALVSPGKYRLLVIPSSQWMYQLEASWLERVPVNKRKGGGIRIKSIRNIDGLGNQTVRNYDYNDDTGYTSGLLLNTPKYDARFTVFGKAWEWIGPTCYFDNDLYLVTAQNLSPSGLVSGPGIVGYKKITESNDGGGKMVYFYHCVKGSESDFPGLPTAGDPFNGRLDSILIYNDAGILLKRTKYYFSNKETNSLRGAKLFSIPEEYTGEGIFVYEARTYENHSFWVTTDKEEETTYSSSGAVVTTKLYYHENKIHREPTRTVVVKSNDDTLITKYKRPDDYTAGNGNSFAEQMKNNHILAPIIEQQTLLKRGANIKLLSGIFTSFGHYNNRFFKPSVTYVIETEAPLTTPTESSFGSNGQPAFHSAYKVNINYDQYNNIGGLISFHTTDNVSKSYLYGYNQSLPIAEAVNVSALNFFHTSFEETGGNSARGDAKTGKYSRASGYTTNVSTLSPGSYLLSYWKKESGVWSYHESTVSVPGTTYSINLTGQIDEVRLYPKDARMTTYTYDPLVGMTSMTDENNQTTSYEYDGFGRLHIVRDQEGKIIRKVCYNYAGQPEDCND